MFSALRRPNRPRRGVTLVEMLVVVALVVLMMVILVQIFQSALGAMSASRTTQELDVVLRQIDSMIRSDLGGVTAKMTPPNDPALKQGYFEYAENSPADLQGEDTDDFLAFTTKAREGQFFSGRQWLSKVVQVGNNSVQTINQNIQPTTINSQVAEVIYFLRNGNLYRRVFLVVPDRALSVQTSGTGTLAGGGYQTGMFGPSLFASWQGLNDISARPGGFDGAGNPLPPILNDLGDLTNREYRAFRPRFIGDFKSPNPNNYNQPDGIPDDGNADGVPDYYPTLYTDGVGANGRPNQLINEVLPYPVAGLARLNTASHDIYAFPFIYPGLYSVPDPNRMNALGWVHNPSHTAAGALVNHSPLDIGEPTTPTDFTMNFASGGRQTWYGFPTWRETMARRTNNNALPGWTDPIVFIGRNGNYTQPLGLRPYAPNANPTTTIAGNLLPPVYSPGTTTPPFSFDGAGSANFVADPITAGSSQSYYPTRLWEDDLILTNVRSFDVKAYDSDAPLYSTTANGLFSAGYQDLGYGSASYIGGPNGATATSQTAVPFQAVNAPPHGFGHEGRMPPLLTDFRIHPRRPTYVDNAGNVQPYNVGDGGAGVIRLTRTFDTWSTAYTNAPDSDIQLNGYSNSGLSIYPSFPPPYPSPLRGIQIQIRVVDPRNEKSKVLTIRHDFTDKLTN